VFGVHSSQNWRLADGGVNWLVGRDTGYEFGWKLRAGSLTPVNSSYLTVGEYIFTDSTGAQYVLNQCCWPADTRDSQRRPGGADSPPAIRLRHSDHQSRTAAISSSHRQRPRGLRLGWHIHYQDRTADIKLSLRQRFLPIVTFPFSVLVSLVGQINVELPVVIQSEVQVKILAACFNPHPPLIVRHLLQMN
jgi:hypothetical protein